VQKAKMASGYNFCRRGRFFGLFTPYFATENIIEDQNTADIFNYFDTLLDRIDHLKKDAKKVRDYKRT